MFADNEKISAKQLGRLLCLDWIAKFCILLPLLLKSLRGWEQITALAFGAVWAYFYAVILGKLAGRITRSFTGYLSERLGKYFACTAGILYFLYMLLNQVYLAWAAGKICGLFLLPEMKETVIGILFLLAGLMTALGSIQKRARLAQCLYPVAAGMLVVMIAASAGSVKWENLRLPENPALPGILSGSVCIFAAFSGMGIALYEIPYVNRKKEGERNAAGTQISRVIKKSLLYTAVFMTVLFVIMLGAFGEDELIFLPFPALVLMSNVNIPGGFLQRWDIVFLSVLLLSLFAASGNGIYYMSRILREVFPMAGKKGYPWYAACISALAMLIVGSYETAEKIFVKWAFCAFLPLTAAFPVLLWILEWVNIKHGKRRRAHGADQTENL